MSWTGLDASRLAVLQQPLRLGRLELRNRLVMAPHTTAFTSDTAGNLPTERHVDYYGERARGGIGLIVTEGLHVHRTSFQAREIDASTDAAVPGLAAIADAVHGGGAPVVAQIMHTGGHGGNLRTGWVAPSPLPWATTAPVPHELTPGEIRELAVAFGTTASRLVRAGFDGVEVHLGHGHLLHQFLSPATNLRADGFGGDRARAVRETLDQVAAGLAAGSILGIRISADDFLPDGLGLDDALELVGALLAAYPIDYVHVSHSMYVEGLTLATQIADTSFPPGAFRALPAAFKRAFPDTTVIAVCRLDDAATAVSVIEEHEADLIAMARQLIVEPELANKLAAGQLDRIRSCIHCNQGCVGRLEIGAAITCVVKPEVGFERVFARVRRPAAARRVLVVGGGPAGLQAAVEARARGHDVRLVEARQVLGGEVRAAAALAGRGELALLVDELARDAARLGVQVELGTRLAPDDLLAGEPSAVVVATGATTERAELAGADRVWTVHEAIARAEALGDAVAVWDRDGSWSGAGLAEHLARLGKRVVLVSPAAVVAWAVTVYSKLALVPRLVELGVELRTFERPVRLEDGGLVLASVVTGREQPPVPVTDVVATGGRRADDGLFRALEGGGFRGEAHLVGDAFAPRSALEAVFDGKVAGAAIGLAREAALELPGRPGYVLG